MPSPTRCSSSSASDFIQNNSNCLSISKGVSCGSQNLLLRVFPVGLMDSNRPRPQIPLLEVNLIHIPHRARGVLFLYTIYGSYSRLPILQKTYEITHTLNRRPKSPVRCGALPLSTTKTERARYTNRISLTFISHGHYDHTDSRRRSPYYPQAGWHQHSHRILCF